jgi:hypothetical protein
MALLTFTPQQNGKEEEPSKSLANRNKYTNREIGLIGLFNKVGCQRMGMSRKQLEPAFLS